MAGLSYRETLKQNDKLNRRAVTLHADLNGLAFGKSHGRECIGHMYFDVSAVNSGYRRVTITDFYGLESTGVRFQIARTGSRNAMKGVSYTGPKLPLVLEDGEQASFTVDLVPLALLARSDTIIRSEPGQHLTGVLVTSNLAREARVELPYQRTYRLNRKSGKSVLTDLCPTPRKSPARSK